MTNCVLALYGAGRFIAKDCDSIRTRYDGLHVEMVANELCVENTHNNERPTDARRLCPTVCAAHKVLTKARNIHTQHALMTNRARTSTVTGNAQCS